MLNRNRENLSGENIILALYFLLAPFEYMLNFGFGTINRYLAILYMGLIFIKIYKNNIKIKKHDGIIFSIIIMIIIPILSVLWALDTNVAIKRNGAYILLSVMFLVTYVRKSNCRELDLINKCIIASGVLLSVYMLSLNRELLFIGRAVLTEESGPNGLAAHLLLPFILSLSIAFKSKKNRRVLNYLFSGLMLFIVLMTGSRGALLAFGTGILILIRKYFKNSKITNVIKIILGSILVGIVIFQFIPKEIMLRYFGEDSFSKDLISQKSRTFIWRDTINYLIPERPILGYGSGNSSVAMEKIRGYPMITHNTYLNMIVEYGMLFIPIFIIFIYSFYKKIKTLKQDYFSMALLISMLVISFFLNTYSFKSFWNVFIYLGLLINKEQFFTINKR